MIRLRISKNTHTEVDKARLDFIYLNGNFAKCIREHLRNFSSTTSPLCHSHTRRRVKTPLFPRRTSPERVHLLSGRNGVQSLFALRKLRFRSRSHTDVDNTRLITRSNFPENVKLCHDEFPCEREKCSARFHFVLCRAGVPRRRHQMAVSCVQKLIFNCDSVIRGSCGYAFVEIPSKLQPRVV